MKNAENDQFDIDALRRKVSEIKTIPVEGETGKGGSKKASELNDFAKRTAKQFREDKFSPSIITGLFRLMDFVALFLIGSAINLLYVQPDFELAMIYGVVLAVGAGVSVLFIQIADGYLISMLRTPGAALPGS